MEPVEDTKGQKKHDREYGAMALNLKEQRVLQKTLRTLQLEKSLALKLLQLDKKQVKVFQKRLCAKVGKIRSHLSVEDIALMRTLESEGRFKSQYNPVNASNLITILAATKRLKLLTNDQIKQLVEDDFSPEDDEITITEIKPIPPSTPKRATSGTYRSNRSSSLPPELPSAIRSESRVAPSKSAKLPSIRSRNPSESSDVVDGSLARSRSRSCSRASIRTEDIDEAANYIQRPKSRMLSRPVSGMDKPSQGSQTARPPVDSAKIVRPVTTGGYLSARAKTAREYGKPPPSSRSRPKTSLGLENSGLNYSSHANIVLQENKSMRDNRGRRMSILSSSSLGSELAKEKAAGFRRELLAVEQKHCDSVEEKRQVFLTRIKKWVEENPAIVGDDKGPKYHFLDKNENLLIPTEDIAVATNEGLYKEEEVDAWKDLTKCRYLRITDDKVDLSGVKTLVKDQIHLFTGLRSNYSRPTVQT